MFMMRPHKDDPEINWPKTKVVCGSTHNQLHECTSLYQLYQFCGGFPQGSKIGRDCFLSASNDSADEVPTEDRFKYIDDLLILELIMLTGLLQDYDTYMHVTSDIPLDHEYLNASSTNMHFGHPKTS